MAVWTEKSGSGYTADRPHLFREETRKWYVWMESDATTLTVKVYDTLANATAGNANFSASGTAAVAGETQHTVTLTNNGSYAPTFTGATVRVTLDAVAQTGINIWECDLGTNMARSVLAVHRAFAGISKANGYFTDVDTAELGIRQWEIADRDGVMPYVGLAGVTILSEPGGIGYNVDTRFRIQGVAHLKHDPLDPTILHFYHDLRRALVKTVKPATAYDGAVSDLPIWSWAILNLADKDAAVDFQSEMGTIEFDVVVELSEVESEITGG